MSKLKTIILLIILTANTYASGIDISKEYLFSKTQIQNEAFNDDLLVSYLRSQTILLIPGVLSESFSSTSSQRIKVDYLLGEIFNDHEEWLIKEGLPYEYLEVESESSPEENKDFIIQVLEEVQSNVIIFTHSKGGLDTFSALSSRPDLLQKITGIITVQTPFRGSPIADSFSENFITKKLGKWLFKFLGGSEDGMLSLTTTQSKKRNNYYKKDYENIIKSVPVINYGSYKDDSFGWDTPLELFRDFSTIKSGKNDGVVPLSSAFLNDTYQIKESGVDHLNSVTNTSASKRVSIFPQLGFQKKWEFDRTSHFKALLEVLRKVSY